MDNTTPIYSALQKYSQENNLRLHMPGHAGGDGVNAGELKLAAGIDVTEVPGLDDLHLPQDVIKEASGLLAKAFGAAQALFLVNGATSGIHALFLSLENRGETILVPRNAHRSFYGGLVLSGLKPVYIPCQIDTDSGIATSIDTKALQKLLQQTPNAAGVFITSPNYYGAISDIENISSTCANFKLPLFVDEAHGAHFYFHPHYPQPALHSGADAVVLGLHKTWPVFNQGACILVSEEFGRWEDLFACYSLLTTTSPSYPILASIDLARAFMTSEGEKYLDSSWHLSREYHEKINTLPGLKCYQEEDWAQYTGVRQADPLKVLVSIKGLYIDGFQVAHILRNKYHIQVETQGANFILAMFAMFHQRHDWEKFYTALREIAVIYAGTSRGKTLAAIPPLPEVKLSPREAFLAPKRRKVRLQESKGLISAEMAAAYPPGIPCILPGELISDEIVEYLEYLIKSGVKIHGPRYANLEYIEVIE